MKYLIMYETYNLLSSLGYKLFDTKEELQKFIKNKKVGILFVTEYKPIDYDVVIK